MWYESNANEMRNWKHVFKNRLTYSLPFQLPSDLVLMIYSLKFLIPLRRVGMSLHTLSDGMSINFRLLRLSRSVYTDINSSRSKHSWGLGIIFLFQLFDLIICDILFISGFCSFSIHSITCLCFCVTSTNGSQYFYSLAAIRFQIPV